MPFFDPPSPPPARPVPPRRPEWAGPPPNLLPGIVALTQVVARNQDTVAALVGAAVYPSGVELWLTLRSRLSDQQGYGLSGAFGAGGGDLQVGVLLADGARASYPVGSRPAGARLTPGGGFGDAGVSWRRFWLWPLPPDGPVELFVAWPAAGLSEQSTVLDGAQLHAAAGEAVELWPAGEPDALPPRWSGVGGVASAAADLAVLPPAGRQPQDAAAAASAVRAAFEQALTAAEAVSIEAVVQDGVVLAAALEQARANFPEAVGTAWAEVGDVVFLDPRRAAVSFAVHYTGGADFGQQVGYAVHDGQRWQVAYDTYARVLGWAGVTTPPSPPRP